MEISNAIPKGNQIANFTNPFKQSGVRRITLEWSKVLFQDRFEWEGNVYFDGGNTSGRQKFTNTELPPLLKQIESFVKSLEK